METIMDAQKFLQNLLTEAQAQLDFNRSEYGNRFAKEEEKYMAITDALEGFGAEVSMQSFAAMMESVGGTKGCIAAIEKNLV
jgi:hypothetical protein